MKQQRLRVVENLLVWISKHSWNILDLAKIVKERRIHSEYSGWQSDLLTGIPVRALNTVCRRVQYTTGTELRSLRRVPYYQKASDRLSSSRGVIMLSLTKHEFYFWSVFALSLSRRISSEGEAELHWRNGNYAQPDKARILFLKCVTMLSLSLEQFRTKGKPSSTGEMETLSRIQQQEYRN